MGKAKQSVGVKVTAAEEILTSMPKDDVKFEVPITPAEEILAADINVVVEKPPRSAEI